MVLDLELNRTSPTATCDMATEKPSTMNTITISDETDSSTTKDMSLPSPSSLCPTSTIQICQRCSTNSVSASNTASLAGNMKSSEESKEKVLCNGSGKYLLYETYHCIKI